MPDTAHLDEIRNRYALERGRRLRAEGSAQYRAIEKQSDPWADPIVRDTLHDEVDVVVIGAGLSGLTCAALLSKAGVGRVRIMDRAGDVGGTWYWNRYPAAQCDVESYIYLPMLEDMNYMPTAKYVYQPEIFGYLQSIAKKYDLYRYGLFQTDVTELTWDEAAGQWIVGTDRGDSFRTRYVVSAGGFLQRPKMPGVPGLEDFQGAVFHSNLWDYEYTGGGPGRDGGGLPNLRDKRVGLVGTGASGLQITTPVAQAAEHLYVFQRTPVVILPRGNRPTDEEWVKSLKPGWHKERVETFNRRGNAYLDEPDPIGDGWTEVVFPVMAKHGAGLFGDEQARREAELFDLETMDAVRRRVSDVVEDPETAAKLMPYFRMLCKRPSFHDEYLQAFNRPNVTLVDTQGAGLEKVVANGVVVGGQTYELDCIILATGFDTGRGLLKSWGVDPVGRDGVSLSEYWGKGMRTFHGVHVHNFPNLFLHSTTQNAGPPNYSSSSVEISEHIVYIISTLQARGAKQVETTVEAEDAWVETIQASVPETHLEFFRNCTPGYYNNDGDLEDINRLGANNFLAGSVAFYDIIRSWRAADELAGLELK